MRGFRLAKADVSRCLKLYGYELGILWSGQGSGNDFCMLLEHDERQAETSETAKVCAQITRD
jgi:hypothetical protein